MSTQPIPPPTPLDALRAVRSQGKTILEVFDHLPWFAREARSWKRWRAFLAAVYGLPMDEEELDIFRACTGRRHPPTTEATTVCAIVGRRGGKTAINATIMGYESCYRDYTPYLQPGERCFFPVVAADKKGARSAANYIQAFLKAAAFIGTVDADEVERPATLNTRLDFRSAPITIEVFTASYRTTRGYTTPVFLGDEIAFWRTADDSANPDKEILKAVRPGMATIPRAKMLLLSSPYAERGILYELYDQRWGVDTPNTLVWKADTCYMNPSEQVALLVAQAYDEDPVAADAEYGGNFRKDVSRFLSPDVVRACIDPGVTEVPPWDARSQRLHPWERVQYHGFVDVAGGSGPDAFALSVAHWDKERGIAVQDYVQRWPAPFSPAAVTKEACAILKRYRLERVVGDRYGEAWPRERFAEYGIAYEVARFTKHEIYKGVLPTFNSRKVLLLDVVQQTKELLELDRRTTPLGKDVVDHPKDGHDDVANVLCGALLLASEEGRWMQDVEQEQEPAETTHDIVRREVRKMVDEASSKPSQGQVDIWDMW